MIERVQNRAEKCLMNHTDVEECGATVGDQCAQKHGEGERER